jgi:hypothetical protein
MFYVERKNGTYIALGGKAGLGDNDSMSVLTRELKQSAGVTEFTCVKGPRKFRGIDYFHVMTKQTPRMQHSGAHIIKRTFQQLKASKTKCDLFLRLLITVVTHKNDLISVDEDADVRAAPAAAPTAAPAAASAAPPVLQRQMLVTRVNAFYHQKKKFKLSMMPLLLRKRSSRFPRRSMNVRDCLSNFEFGGFCINSSITFCFSHFSSNNVYLTDVVA